MWSLFNKQLGRLVGLLLATVFSLCAASSVARADVWLTNALAKVHADAAAGTQRTLRLSSARNEFESFQVHVRPTAAPVNLNIAVSDFTRAAGGGVIAAATQVALYREAYLNITALSDAQGQLGMTPDPLIPTRDPYVGEARNAFPVTVPVGQTQSAWVDVLVPANAAPGIYLATVTVFDGTSVIASLPVSLRVWDFALPSTATLKSTFGMSFMGMCIQAYGGYNDCNHYPGAVSSDDATNLTHVAQATLALDHRITIGDGLINSSGHNVDWSQFETIYGPLLNGTSAALLSGATMTALQFPKQNPLVGSDLQDWVTNASSRGWLDRLYQYTCDEPPNGCTWPDALSLEQAVHSAAPLMKTLITTDIASATANGLLTNLNIIVPVVNEMDPRSGNLRSTYDSWLQDTTKHLWWYQSCSSHGSCTNGIAGDTSSTWPSYMIDATPVRNRVFQWLSFINRVEGELYYATDFCWYAAYACGNDPSSTFNDPWTTVYAFGGNGDGTLMYPGTPAKIGGTTPVPLPSIRLKHIRDGMEDFEYLHAVSALGDDAFARTTAASFITSSSDFSNDPQALGSAREALGNHLHQAADNAVATTTSLAMSANPAVVSQPVHVTVSVAGATAGSVTLYDGATALANSALASGVATFDIATLDLGDHILIAVYTGNATSAPSVSDGAIQTVAQASSSVSVATSLTPSSFGQSVTFTATLSATAPATGTPTGTVTFKDGGTVIGADTLSGGVASVTTSSLAIGGHVITAAYGGDTNFASSTSGGITQTVNKLATTLSLVSSPNPGSAAQSVTFTAALSSNGGIPTGTVTFMEGASAIGSSTTNGGGVATLTTTLSAGAHSITAVYGGGATFLGSTSNTLIQSVVKVPTTLVLTSTPNPAAAGSTVTLTATLTTAAGGSPTGNVSFADGSAIVGTAALSGISASLSTAAMTAGAHGLTATYAGDAVFAGSTSSAVNQLVALACTDQLASATALPGASGTAFGSNAGATGEANEPNHAGGSLPLASVWCKWTAPANGTVTFDTTGSNFDTTLAVYTGASVAALSSIAANNDIAAGNVQSRVSFTAAQGTTYLIAIDGAGTATGNYTLTWAQTAANASTFASVLPSARSVSTGTAATAFASIINAGTAAATGCSVALPPGFPGSFSYQTTTAANVPNGSPNTPADIAANGTQNYVFAITPMRDINAAEVALVFGCANTPATVTVPGLNTLLLSASSAPSPDLISIGATPSNDGILDIPGATGTILFAAATINIGSAGTIVASIDDNGRSLPVVATLCQSNPATAACINPATPSPSATLQIGASQVATFTVSVSGTGLVPFDPANNRLFLRFKTPDGVTRGATSVAVRTQ